MDGWLVTQDEQGHYWYLLHGELAGSSFDMQQTHQLVTTLSALEGELKTRYPQAQLLSRGTVFTVITPASRRNRISPPLAWRRFWA